MELIKGSLGRCLNESMFLMPSQFQKFRRNHRVRLQKTTSHFYQQTLPAKVCVDKFWPVMFYFPPEPEGTIMWVKVELLVRLRPASSLLPSPQTLCGRLCLCFLVHGGDLECVWMYTPTHARQTRSSTHGFSCKNNSVLVFSSPTTFGKLVVRVYVCVLRVYFSPPASAPASLCQDETYQCQSPNSMSRHSSKPERDREFVRVRVCMCV